MDRVIEIKNGVIYRLYPGYKVMVTEWCILGDCNQPECHHCFPVKNCKKHELCIREGTCELIDIKKKYKKK